MTCYRDVSAAGFCNALGARCVCKKPGRELPQELALLVGDNHDLPGGIRVLLAGGDLTGNWLRACRGQLTGLLHLDCHAVWAGIVEVTAFHGIQAEIKGGADAGALLGVALAGRGVAVINRPRRI